MKTSGERVSKPVERFEHKRLYYSKEHKQFFLVFWLGGNHGPLNVSKLVMERFLGWEEGSEYTEQMNIHAIPEDCTYIKNVPRDFDLHFYYNEGKEEDEKKKAKEEVDEMFQDAFRQFLQAYIVFAGMEEAPYNVDELSFIKTPIEMPNGGKYLLLLSHVEGPKIPMK